MSSVGGDAANVIGHSSLQSGEAIYIHQEHNRRNMPYVSSEFLDIKRVFNILTTTLEKNQLIHAPRLRKRFANAKISRGFTNTHQRANEWLLMKLSLRF